MNVPQRDDVPPVIPLFGSRGEPRADDLLHAKLEALAEFAAGAGHEINNPLASILICTERLLKGEADPERRRLLATIGGQAVRIRDMIGDVMLFARPPQPQPRDLDLSAAVRSVVSRFAERMTERQIALSGDYSSPVSLCVDPTQLNVVISELLRNAIEAVDDGGEIRIDTRTEIDGARKWGVLTMADNGRGLTEQEREHLFDPFFSGRQAGRGLGFGLPKAWRIVTNHGGRIDVASQPTQGVRVTVRMPDSGTGAAS